MFIGDRTNGNGGTVTIDEEKLATSLASKIKLPDIDASTIVSKINNPINTNTAQLVAPFHTEHDNINTRIKDNVVAPLDIIKNDIHFIGDTLDTINTKIDSGGGGGDSGGTIYIQPILVHEQYVKFTVKVEVYNDFQGYYETYYSLDCLSAKISMYEHYIKIELYDGYVLKGPEAGGASMVNYNNNDAHCDIYLEGDNIIKVAEGKEDKLLQYYKAFLNTYPNDGSNSVSFPIDGTLNRNFERIPNHFDLYFFTINDNYTANFHIRKDGIDANEYQAIAPQTIITKYMDTGVKEYI